MSFETAIALFDAIHAEDSSGRARRYHDALSRWVERLGPAPSEALRLAARCQHLRRAAIPRSDYPEGLAGYKRWRAAAALAHARDAGEILAHAGYDEATIARVGDLLVKKRLRSDPEVQRFEDAICLTFLEIDAPAFAAKHPADKVVDVVKKTWAKMSERGRNEAHALAPTLPEGVRALVLRAVGP